MLANISDFEYYISPYPDNCFSPEKVIRLVHIFKSLPWKQEKGAVGSGFILFPIYAMKVQTREQMTTVINGEKRVNVIYQRIFTLAKGNRYNIWRNMTFTPKHFDSYNADDKLDNLALCLLSFGN